MIGNLDQRITLERLSATKDDMGGDIETWATLATVWAQVRPVGGSETWQAMRTTGAAQYAATIRWQGDANGQPFVTSLDRVQWRGRTYGIEVVTMSEDRQRWINLALTEGQAS